MAGHKDVLVVGSCMIDLISYAPRLPNRGETLEGTKFNVGFGGKGCNQCVAARKLSASAGLVARVGADSFGRDYIQQLDALGIPKKYVGITEGVSSGMAQIIVADNGENQIVIVPGANNHLSEDDVRKASSEISECSVLLTQMEIQAETTISALKIKAESKKGISIFNAAPAQSSLDPQLYQLPTIFCVNETEAELLTGEPLTTIEEAEKACKILRGKGCQHVIITLGEKGAGYLDTDMNFIHVPSKPVNVVDTTGAGDAFLGALGYFLAKNSTIGIPEAIHRACEVAAISVQKNGTQTSFPTLEELPKSLTQF